MSEDNSKERSPKRVVYALVLSLVVALVGTIIFLEYDKVVNEDNILRQDYPLGNFECEGWVQEGKVLVRKYYPITNMNLWEPSDNVKMINLENQVLYHCTTKKIDVIQNLPMCLDTWIILDDLLERMTVDGEKLTNSLSESDQEKYHTNYSKYFDSGCDLLQDDIDDILAKQ